MSNSKLAGSLARPFLHRVERFIKFVATLPQTRETEKIRRGSAIAGNHVA